jgi:uncharacterized protein (DUF1330 family)
MAAYAIFIREKLRDPDVIEKYNDKAGPSLEGHPAKVLAAYGAIEAPEGAPSEGVVLLEFPTMAAAKAWYDGPPTAKRGSSASRPPTTACSSSRDSSEACGPGRPAGCARSAPPSR